MEQRLSRFVFLHPCEAFPALMSWSEKLRELILRNSAKIQTTPTLPTPPNNPQNLTCTPTLTNPLPDKRRLRWWQRSVAFGDHWLQRTASLNPCGDFEEERYQQSSQTSSGTWQETKISAQKKLPNYTRQRGRGERMKGSRRRRWRRNPD